MAVFVINEWLWADSAGENGLQAQGDAFKIITRLAESDHQIVVVEGSPFDQKAWKLCKSTNPMILQAIARAYVAGVRQNSDRCRILKPEHTVALSVELARAVNADDHYLVKSLLSVDGAVLVTTDRDLREAVVTAGRSCLSREEFSAQIFLSG